MSDPIFARTEPLQDEDCEPLEDYSRCNCCGDSTKLSKFKNWYVFRPQKLFLLISIILLIFECLVIFAVISSVPSALTDKELSNKVTKEKI